MESTEWLVAAIPAVATGAATYAVAKAQQRAANAREQAAAHASVEIAEIEAHTADQKTLLDWMQVADRRHAADVDRLYAEMGKVALLQTEVALLREKLTQTEVEVLILKGKLEQANH